MPRALIAVAYQHGEHEGLGLLEPALREAGFALDLRPIGEVWPQDARADLVVAMGGPMGAYEASRFPFLLGELGILRARVASRRPVLGVCLGAQLLAAAAGARVFPGAQGKEIGVEPVSLTDAGREDPAFSILPPAFFAAHWHGDTWDEVPGAVLLAATRYPQAFRLGPSYGLQFHPELSREAFSAWLLHGAAQVATLGKSPARLSEELLRLEGAAPLTSGLLARLAQHFARVASRR